MRKFIINIINNILVLPLFSKRALAILTDIAFCVLCTWAGFIIRFEELISFDNFNFNPALISIFIAIPIFWFFGLYQTIFRYSGISIVFNVITSTLAYGMIYFSIIGIYGITGVPRSIGIIQPMLLFFGIIGSRLLAKKVLSLQHINKNFNIKKNTLIYGAGDTGRQLKIVLESNLEVSVKGFIDDNIHKQNQYLSGAYIYSPDNLNEIILTKKINLILLAMPKVSRAERNKIIENLSKFKIAVKTLPNISEIIDGRISFSDIKDFDINDLLNREEIKPDNELLLKNVFQKTVVVVGAGGSIGSELSKQIIRLNPKKLILIELNEYALYNIKEDLRAYDKNSKIIPFLMNAQNQIKLEMIFEKFSVDTVYHAAAYKHVPLVEENICEGLKNNVYSTLAIAKASISKKISNLVLISSDKAVRPTNIMGVSKRLSELCMQGLYQDIKEDNINFSIVRFGNVLESSGSVIPKFKKQIQEGGPVTLTHEEVTRYFMTVTEAAQLVIQAGSMGKCSEVFVLDMGESIKIKDLIYKMILLSGLTLKDKKNLTGDIEIKIIGLRAGEKLYEELLIGDNPEKTSHPKIQKINDPFIPYNLLEKYLDELKILLDTHDVVNLKKVLHKIIPQYNPQSEIVDHLYVEKSLLKNESLNDLTIIRGKDSQNIN